MEVVKVAEGIIELSWLIGYPWETSRGAPLINYHNGDYVDRIALQSMGSERIRQDWETNTFTFIIEIETGADFIFLGSRFTVDGDCSLEIKRQLLLGRKAMTNLDSVLKSRDITLPTKVHLVNAMAFSVVMYGCESWNIKKSECWIIDAFKLWCWRRLLRVPLDRKKIKPVNPKPTLMLKLTLQYFGHLMWRANSLETTLTCWERLKVGGEGGNRAWNEWMVSLNQWTWVWANSGW